MPDTGASSKPPRPRDELGRPLPWGSENRLPMEDFDALSIEENHRLACAYFNAGNYFPAHEAWEAAWKAARGTGDEEIFKGLAQLGAGYVHYRRGNPHGTKTLLRRAVSRIAETPTGWRGVDLPAVAGLAAAHAASVEAADDAGEGLPAIDPPTI